MTLLDVAGTEPRRLVERVCDQAEVLRLFDRRAIEAVLKRRAGERGAGVLRAILAQHAIGEAVTKRELEERFLRLCRRAGLPRSEVNADVAGAREWWEVDFLWPGSRLVVETDGLAFHRTPARIERDRRRDLDLTAAGYRVVRLTWRQVTREPETVVSTLRPLLASVSAT